MYAEAMIAAAVLLGHGLATVDQRLGSLKQFVSASGSWSRVKGLLARYPEAPAAMPLPEPVGRLSIEGLTYLPPGQSKPILQNVSFAGEPGMVLCIIGPLGHGKTTLCGLMRGAPRQSHCNVRLHHSDLAAWNPETVGPPTSRK